MIAEFLALSPAVVAGVMTVLVVATAVVIGETAASASTGVIAKIGHHAAVSPAARMAPVKAAGEAVGKAAGEAAERAEEEVAERAAEEAVERAAGVEEASEGVTGNILNKNVLLRRCMVFFDIKPVMKAFNPLRKHTWAITFQSVQRRPLHCPYLAYGLGHYCA